MEAIEKAPRPARPRSAARRAINRRLIAALVLLALGLPVSYLLALNFVGGSSTTGSELATPAAQSAPAVPLRGWIDVRIWAPDSERRRGLRLNQAGALPLQAGDWVRVEAELNRPAYLYVIWIDSEGKAAPVYPWRPGRWNERPEQEQPRSRLSLPEESDSGWPIRRGPAGMETLLLLARATPLPRNVDLTMQFKDLPVPHRQHPQSAVWFENGAVAWEEKERGPNFFDVQRIDDPVLQTQRLIKDRLAPLCDFSRAVSFTNEGK